MIRMCLAIALLAPGAANARAVLTGTFAGTSFDTRIYTPPYERDFDGTPATGSFRIDLTGCSDQSFGNPYYGPNCGGSSGSFSDPQTYLTLNTSQGTAQFRVPEYDMRVIDGPISQTIEINFTFRDPYSYSYLTIAGGPGAFVRGGDFGRLYTGAIDVAGSSLNYQLGRSYAGRVALTSLAFDQVPEPASWLAFTALVIVSMARRARSGSAQN